MQPGVLEGKFFQDHSTFIFISEEMEIVCFYRKRGELVVVRKNMHVTVAFKGVIPKKDEVCQASKSFELIYL